MQRILLRMILPPLLALAGVVLLLVGCTFWSTPAPQAEATIAALSTENARLAAAVATLATPLASPVAAPATTTAAQSLTEPPTQPSQQPTQPALESTIRMTASQAASISPLATPTATLFATPILAARAATTAVRDLPLPQPVAEMALGDADARLIDLRLDAAANRLYVTTSSGHFYSLDGNAQAILATLPVAGEIILDPPRSRLFVAPASRYYQPEPAIAVVDTQALTITGYITGATHLALDSEHNRLFVGQRLSSPYSTSDPPVRMLDGATLGLIRTLPQAGAPVFNPRRNEVIIVAHSAYVADPESGAITQDLFPAISGQDCLDCVGGERVADALVFANEDLLALAVERIGTAGGVGTVAAPQFLRATTLEPLRDPATQPVIQAGCGSEKSLQPTVGGKVYRHQLFARYVVYNNLLVFDETGSLLTWYDGVAAPYVNASTGQLYAGEWIYTLDPLQPVGRLPAGFCLFHQENGLLYGSQANRLLVLSERGGAADGPANQAVASLAGQPINQIVVSPAFASDNTLFVVHGHNRLMRSNDGGEAWLHLRNGLLLDGVGRMTVAMSPDFANDRSLFAAGYQREAFGGGLFRSLDGGDHWQAAWPGLQHLRIYELSVSPGYASDRTVLAQADYLRISPWEAGDSIQRTDDGGVTWSLMATTTNEMTPFSSAELLPTAPPARVSARRTASGRGIERTLDGGATWQPIELGQSPTSAVVAIVPATADAANGVAYVLGTDALWRVASDGGVDQWLDQRLAGRSYTNTLTALAISPPLSDGSQRLWIGSAAGEFWSLDPAALTWQAVEVVVSDAVDPTAVAAPAPNPTATGTISVTSTVTIPVIGSPGAPPTPWPTPASLGGEPPSGLFPPAETFAGVWSSNGELQNRLGWAKRAEVAPVSAAYQTYERGSMLWRSDEERIYVLYDDGRWEVFDDTFQEGQPESDPSLSVPDNRLQPVRGFGKVWREQPQVRERLGWATARESGVTVQVQPFERGSLVWLNGIIYALSEEADGTRRWLVA